MDTSNCPPDTSKSMVFIPELKDSINSWITDVIGYIKTPPDSGGIGDDKHLYQITYNGIENGNNALYGTFSNYYSLYNNSKLDIAGMSSYFDEKEMMNSRAKYAILLKDSFPQKPFHFDEGNSPGFILNDTKTTSTHYNNYDVTFHNELWASAFMGGFTTLGPWEGEVVHRWKHATPDSLGWAFPMTVHDTVPPYIFTLTVLDTVNSYFHNFKPLSDFTSLIDFDQSYQPCSYYGATTDYIESYYLKNADSTNAFGWIHNINKYWENSYYLQIGNDIYENYFGCDTSPQPSTVLNLPDFKHSHTYYIYFFRTRIGSQTVPSTDTILSDNSGNLTIDLSSSPLGCDSMSADYAYLISDSPFDFSGTRYSRTNSVSNRMLNVSIAPNPSNGVFKVMLDQEERSDTKIELFDITGKVVFKSRQNSNLLSLNLADKPKGVYYLRVFSNGYLVMKKIIIF